MGWDLDLPFLLTTRPVLAEQRFVHLLLVRVSSLALKGHHSSILDLGPRRCPVSGPGLAGLPVVDQGRDLWEAERAG